MLVLGKTIVQNVSFTWFYANLQGFLNAEKMLRL